MRFVKHGGRVALTVLFLTGAATPASADWLLTPYLGIVFGGAANTVDIEDFDESFEQRFTFGASVGWMGGGKVGFEVDFSQSPNFFQVTEGGEDFDLLNIDSSITTFMANILVGASSGTVRPYFAGGAGLLRANISADELFENLSTNELGINVGGGLNIFFSDNVGLRGDVRYFRGLQQEDDDDPDPDDDFIDEDFGLEDFDYWRGTIGLTFRFGR
jgi:opacity protein-like surface antigen